MCLLFFCIQKKINKQWMGYIGWPKHIIAMRWWRVLLANVSMGHLTCSTGLLMRANHFSGVWLSMWERYTTHINMEYMRWRSFIHYWISEWRTIWHLSPSSNQYLQNIQLAVYFTANFVGINSLSHVFVYELLHTEASQSLERILIAFYCIISIGIVSRLWFCSKIGWRHFGLHAGLPTGHTGMDFVTKRHQSSICWSYQ